jgi:hypothetical protein
VQAALNARAGNQRARFALFSGLAAAVAGAGLFCSVYMVIGPDLREKAFQTEPELLNYAIIPRTAPADTSDLPTMNRAVLSGPGAATVRQWEPQHRVIAVRSAGANALLIRTFNFPGWIAALGGKPLPIKTDPGDRRNSSGGASRRSFDRAGLHEHARSPGRRDHLTELAGASCGGFFRSTASLLYAPWRYLRRTEITRP